MKDNPIPEELRSDHLFLLVGTNPLPNWVAAKLLLKPTGRVHLFQTAGVRKQAGRLKKVLEDGEKIPVSIYETADADEDRIFNDVSKQAAKLVDAGKIGLSYTGGTKMMSVHANRAIREAVPEKNRVLSYLDAHTLEFKFDGCSKTESAELRPEVRINIKTLLDLHDLYTSVTSNSNPQCPAAAEGLVEVHSHYWGQRTWREWCDGLDIGRTNPKRLRDDERRRICDRLDSVVLPVVTDFIADVTSRLNREVSKGGLSNREARSYAAGIEAGYRRFLSELSSVGGEHLQTVAQRHSEEFNDSLDLAKWLDGMWLEHHTLAQIQHCAATAAASETIINENGCAINLEAINSEGREFEADVIALRGYQLFYFSCYTGSEKDKSKQKLFEAMRRAAQLGGDEAKVALVCASDQRVKIRQECETDWQMENINRIRVFGREDLPRLAESLRDWFNGEK